MMRVKKKRVMNRHLDLFLRKRRKQNNKVQMKRKKMKVIMSQTRKRISQVKQIKRMIVTKKKVMRMKRLLRKELRRIVSLQMIKRMAIIRSLNRRLRN